MSDTPRTPKFVFLLNALERAAQAQNPSEYGYAGHRAKALDYVATLERDLARLTAENAEAKRLLLEDFHKAHEWKSRAEKAEAENEALRKDAERFRFLKRVYFDTKMSAFQLIGPTRTPEELDAALDAAIKEGS